MVHPDTEIQFISDEIGYGVVATKLIKKGTITWVQDELDVVYKPNEVAKMGQMAQEMVEKYTFRNNKGHFVMCWDIAKYVNHSFNSNCFSTAYDFEIAIRDIHPGEELTDDYGYLNVTEQFPAKDEGTERTTVYPDDLKHFYKHWDKKLQDAFPYIKKVNQPLKPILSAEISQKIAAVLKGQKQLDSILNLYFQENQ